MHEQSNPYQQALVSPIVEVPSPAAKRTCPYALALPGDALEKHGRVAMLRRWSVLGPTIVGFIYAAGSCAALTAQELPAPDKTKTVELFRVPNYCEGVCFDHDGNGYISGRSRSPVLARREEYGLAETDNGHKILSDGTHLVCVPASMPCSSSPPTASARSGLQGMRRQATAGPNDLTLDTANGGFYFGDPGQLDRQPDRHDSLRR
jgi:hypothetical protein